MQHVQVHQWLRPFHCEIQFSATFHNANWEIIGTNATWQNIATDTISVVVPGSTQYEVKNNGQNTGGGVDIKRFVIDLTSSDALSSSESFITTAVEDAVHWRFRGG